MYTLGTIREFKTRNFKVIVDAVEENDPRGCVLKIVFPDGYTNDWGKEGICVPV